MQKSYIANTPRAGAYEEPERFNSILAKGFYFEDSENMIFSSLDLLYTRNEISENVDIAVDGGSFSLGKKCAQKYDGRKYGASLFYNHFSFRLGLNKYEDFSEIVPSIQYQNTYNRHSYSLAYIRQNALFYNYALCSYEQRITADHFNLSDFIILGKNIDLWANVEANAFSNSNIEITTQFDWRFYYDRAFNKHYSYHYALEGWYTTHSNPNECYYSPRLSDATLVRFDPQYKFSEYFGVRGKLGIGYSLKEEMQPYKYGLWAFGNTTKKFSYAVGCLHSNAARLSFGPTYNYTECDVSLGYEW